VKTLARPPKVIVLALGGVPRQLLADAGQELARVFAIGASMVPAQDRPQYAFNKDRAQYHSAAILRRLAGLRGGEVPVVAVTDADLFVPDAPYVFGDADRDAQVAVVSTARLAHGVDGRELPADKLRRRVLVEAVHELGQLFGLSPCSDARCAMYPSHRPSDADRKGPGLCGACRAALGG
jgi:archaemetzincin